MIQNYFQIISELRQLKSSQARVYSIFWCLFLSHLGHIFVCQKRLYSHGLSVVLSIRISIALTVKLFFSGLRIRIMAEDNANAEELELNFGTKKPVRVKGGKSSRNGMWNGVRNGIIMQNTIYAGNKLTEERFLFLRQFCKSSSFSMLRTITVNPGHA